MNRRQFIASIGAAVGAVALGGIPLTAHDPRLDEQFQPGDIFTIEGKFAFNPITRQPTEHLQYFMVTAVTSSDVKFVPHRSDVSRMDRKQALGFHPKKGRNA